MEDVGRFGADAGSLLPARPIFVGEHARRRRWLRALSAACVAACIGFFASVGAGVSESPAVHHAVPTGQAHGVAGARVLPNGR